MARLISRLSEHVSLCPFRILHCRCVAPIDSTVDVQDVRKVHCAGAVLCDVGFLAWGERGAVQLDALEVLEARR